MEVLDKSAKTIYDIHPIIKKRWSPRSFSEQPITADQIDTMLEAASWAPSSRNEQPWRYIFALKENVEGFDKLLNFLNPSNLIWVKNAAALILSYCKLTYDYNESINHTAIHDTGLANQNLFLQAVSMDIFTHPMEGFDKHKAISAFKFSDDYKPLCMIALGYLDIPEKLPEPLNTREIAPRKRKNLSEFTVKL